MSPQLEEMLGALSMNRVPMIWEKFSYPCLKPLASWFDDFVHRVKFIGSWI
jgi:dynein heavy chain